MLASEGHHDRPWRNRWFLLRSNSWEPSRPADKDRWHLGQQQRESPAVTRLAWARREAGEVPSRHRAHGPERSRACLVRRRSSETSRVMLIDRPPAVPRVIRIVGSLS